MTLAALAAALQTDLTPEALEALVDKTTLADLFAVDVTTPEPPQCSLDFEPID